MKYVVQPGGQLSGSHRVPGDKSMSHRAVMLGALAEGATEVTGFLDGDDALATAAAFRDMGVVIEGPTDCRMIIHGAGLQGLAPPPGSVDMGNAGTGMRLLAGILAGQPFDSRLVGDVSLMKRPMGRVIEPLAKMGAVIESGSGGCRHCRSGEGRPCTVFTTICPWPVPR